MSGKAYGYVRVSTKGQKEDRQMIAMREFGVEDENIIIETSDDRVRMELAKWAVSTNNSNPPEDKKGKKKEPAQIEEGSAKGVEEGSPKE